ncbi:MAG: ankyrin repeat domain-containing protein [Planctomycetales bacterium]
MAEPTRALSIRQPAAEAIMRGIKTTEYRNKTTHIRERVYIYAGLGRYPAWEEEEVMAEFGIHDVSCDDLPRGVLVGTVELYDCNEGEWYFRKAERAKTLRKPKNHPQPVWFRPFTELGGGTGSEIGHDGAQGSVAQVQSGNSSSEEEPEMEHQEFTAATVLRKLKTFKYIYVYVVVNSGTADFFHVSKSEAKRAMKALEPEELVFASTSGRGENSILWIGGEVESDVNDTPEASNRPVPSHTDFLEAVLDDDAECVEAMAKDGADLDFLYPEGTALCQAVQDESTAAAAALIEAGANVNIAAKDGATPIHWAAYNGDAELCGILIAEGAKNTTDKHGLDAWDNAQFSKDRETKRVITDAFDIDKKSR